jgi:hypothetical protein
MWPRTGARLSRLRAHKKRYPDTLSRDVTEMTAGNGSKTLAAIPSSDDVAQNCAGCVPPPVTSAIEHPTFGYIPFDMNNLLAQVRAKLVVTVGFINCLAIGEFDF